MSRQYDLEERTARFGEDVIKFCRSIKYDVITRPIVSQLVRSATSVGANYMEANGSSSKKDFRNKIFICRKESQETKHWLRMLSSCLPESEKEANLLRAESHELTLIFAKITNSAKES
ncbi:MAG TPA: four helix bundle protein [Candidatus Paceibacterota bacterium]|nr:four helix bundle protein [Candidatus Paceibacterota bacterium]